MTAIKRLQIRAANFKSCPELQDALNQALADVQDDIAVRLDGVVQLHLLPAMDYVISSNSPGTPPWPIRLAQVAGAPIGASLIRLENLTTPGSTGVPTTSVSITSQHVEAGTVFVDFISGLTLNSSYRMVFGVYNA